MDKPQLRDTLERLHRELEQIQVVDVESRDLLRHLQNDIQAVLKDSNASTRASLRARLGVAAEHFEDSHPNLTLMIQQVLDHLAQV